MIAGSQHIGAIVPRPLLMRRYLDDLCVGSGALLVGVGVWQVSPIAIWFYAGTVLVATGLALGRVRV